MKKMLVLLFFAVFLFSSDVFAQASFSSNRERFGYDTGRLSSFSRDDSSWKRGEGEKEVLRPIAGIVDRLNADAIELILNPDEVQCYNVEPKTASQEGLVMQGYKVLGSCGTIKGSPLEQFQKRVFTSVENVDFSVDRKCNLKPSILLHFKRALDDVNVLISSNPTCHYVIVQYSGETDEINVNPIYSWIKEFVSIAENKREKINIKAPKKLDYTKKEKRFGTKGKEEESGLQDWSSKKEDKPSSGGSWIKNKYSIPSFSKSKTGDQKQETQSPPSSSSSNKNSSGSSSSSGAKVKRNW